MKKNKNWMQQLHSKRYPFFSITFFQKEFALINKKTRPKEVKELACSYRARASGGLELEPGSLIPA